MAGIETGEHFVSLTPGAAQFMNYDSTTGMLTPSEDAILVDIVNTLGEVSAVAVYLEATIDLDPLGDGPASLYGQLTTPLPDGLEGLMFFNSFESGDTSYWSYLPLPAVIAMSGAVLAGGLGISRRRRQKAHGQA